MNDARNRKNTKKAAEAVLKDSTLMLFIYERTKEILAEKQKDALTEERWDDLENNFKIAEAYLNWFTPAWEQLSEEDRYVLDTFFRGDPESALGPVDIVGSAFCLEKPSVYSRKDAALRRLGNRLFTSTEFSHIQSVYLEDDESRGLIYLTQGDGIREECRCAVESFSKIDLMLLRTQEKSFETEKLERYRRCFLAAWNQLTETEQTVLDLLFRNPVSYSAGRCVYEVKDVCDFAQTTVYKVRSLSLDHLARLLFTTCPWGNPLE